MMLLWNAANDADPSGGLKDPRRSLANCKPLSSRIIFLTLPELLLLLVRQTNYVGMPLTVSLRKDAHIKPKDALLQPSPSGGEQ